jgi:hypothetical protein
VPGLPTSVVTFQSGFQRREMIKGTGKWQTPEARFGLELFTDARVNWAHRSVIASADEESEGAIVEVAGAQPSERLDRPLHRLAIARELGAQSRTRWLIVKAAASKTRAAATTPMSSRICPLDALPSEVAAKSLAALLIRRPVTRPSKPMPAHAS